MMMELPRSICIKEEDDSTDGYNNISSPIAPNQEHSTVDVDRSFANMSQEVIIKIENTESLSIKEEDDSLNDAEVELSTSPGRKRTYVRKVVDSTSSNAETAAGRKPKRIRMTKKGGPIGLMRKENSKETNMAAPRPRPDDPPIKNSPNRVHSTLHAIALLQAAAAEMYEHSDQQQAIFTCIGQLALNLTRPQRKAPHGHDQVQMMIRDLANMQQQINELTKRKRSPRPRKSGRASSTLSSSSSSSSSSLAPLAEPPGNSVVPALDSRQAARTTSKPPSHEDRPESERAPSYSPITPERHTSNKERDDDPGTMTKFGSAFSKKRDDGIGTEAKYPKTPASVGMVCPVCKNQGRPFFRFRCVNCKTFWNRLVARRRSVPLGVSTFPAPCIDPEHAERRPPTCSGCRRWRYERALLRAFPSRPLLLPPVTPEGKKKVERETEGCYGGQARETSAGSGPTRASRRKGKKL